jgi:hypothetical protein
LEGKNNPSGRFSSKTKMRYWLRLCFIFWESSNKRDNVLRIDGMSLIGIPSDRILWKSGKVLETGISTNGWGRNIILSIIDWNRVIKLFV